MSRSKREAREPMIPAPNRNKHIWTAGDGGIRTGWLLTVSLFGYTLVTLATRYGLIRAFTALFDTWGVDATNVHRAPTWSRFIYVWHGSIATLAFAALTLLLAGWLRRLWRLEGALLEPPFGGLWKGTVVGILGPLIVAALCLFPDSMRWEWPLTAPRFSWTLPVMAIVSLISTFAEEAFTKRVIYDGLQARWNRLWATVAVCAVFLLGSGFGGSIIGTVNTLLLGGVVCALYARYGFWTSVGFRWGWSMTNVFLLGFGGGDAAVYRFYGVSEALMTGGDTGLMHGLWTTLLLVCMNIALILNIRLHKVS